MRAAGAEYGNPMAVYHARNGGDLEREDIFMSVWYASVNGEGGEVRVAVFPDVSENITPGAEYEMWATKDDSENIWRAHEAPRALVSE